MYIIILLSKHTHVKCLMLYNTYNIIVQNRTHTCLKLSTGRLSRRVDKG